MTSPSDLPWRLLLLLITSSIAVPLLLIPILIYTRILISYPRQ